VCVTCIGDKMKTKILMACVLMSIVFLSGCVSKTPSRSELENTKLIDAYCVSKGYEYGATHYIRSSEGWDYVMKDDGSPTGRVLPDNYVLCIRNVKERATFYPSDYVDYISKVVYINN